GGAGVLAAARAAVAAGRDAGPHRRHVRLPGPRPVAAPQARPAGLTGLAVRPLALAGLAAFFVSFDSAVLVLALPAIAADFRTPVAELGRLGSALSLGTLI